MRTQPRGILRVIVNHGTSGFFAGVCWVLAALRFALAAGLLVYVDHGPCVACGDAPHSLAFPYYDSGLAEQSAWSYFFEPVHDLSGIVDEMSTAVDVVTLSTRATWNLQDNTNAYHVEPYTDDSSMRGDRAHAFRKKQRAAAWSVMQAVRPLNYLRQYIDAFWHGAGLHGHFVLGVHLRGTDKRCEIGGAIIPPDRYFPFIDIFLSYFSNARLLLATDSPAFASRMRARYRPLSAGGRLVVHDSMRAEGNLLHARLTGEGETYAKGVGAVVDMLLLARSDFLLLSNTAVAETSIWMNAKLHTGSIHLQDGDLPSQVRRALDEISVWAGAHPAKQGFRPALMACAANYSEPEC